MDASKVIALFPRLTPRRRTFRSSRFPSRSNTNVEPRCFKPLGASRRPRARSTPRTESSSDIEIILHLETCSSCPSNQVDSELVRPHDVVVLVPLRRQVVRGSPRLDLEAD